jgi:hypothetical protein
MDFVPCSQHPFRLQNFDLQNFDLQKKPHPTKPGFEIASSLNYDPTSQRFANIQYEGKPSHHTIFNLDQETSIIAIDCSQLPIILLKYNINDHPLLLNQHLSQFN